MTFNDDISSLLIIKTQLYMHDFDMKNPKQQQKTTINVSFHWISFLFWMNRDDDLIMMTMICLSCTMTFLYSKKFLSIFHISKGGKTSSNLSLSLSTIFSNNRKIQLNWKLLNKHSILLRSRSHLIYCWMQKPFFSSNWLFWNVFYSLFFNSTIQQSLRLGKNANIKTRKRERVRERERKKRNKAHSNSKIINDLRLLLASFFSYYRSESKSKYFWILLA